MENPISTFKIEDSFNITGRGLVLIGQLVQGEAEPGNSLVFENGTRWRIRAVNIIRNRNRLGLRGLLVEAPATSRQELIANGIIGATALIFAS